MPAGEATARRRVVARGDVQGVFFRASVQEEARRRGVSGWAHNRDDGSVEAVFEGPAGAVEALVELCRAGPGQATVRELDVSDERPQGESGFRTG